MGDINDTFDHILQFQGHDPATEPSRQSYIKFLEGKSESELRWWSKDTVAVVTGSNRGVGFEIVRQLATNGITTILTARDEGRGMAAVEALKAEGLDNVQFHPLDVTKPDSASKLASWLHEKFGGIDILVGNAGAGGFEISYEKAIWTLDVNYQGQKTIISALLPLLRPAPAGARIVIVSSELGKLQFLRSEKLRQQLHDVDHLTQEDVDSLASKYLEDVKAGRQTEEWSNVLFQQYNEAKALLNAYGRLLAKSLSNRPQGNKVYVNMMTPGLTATDLNNYDPRAHPVKEGADTATWLALMPSGGPHGGFFKDRADFAF